jgi:hypothetical protein
MAYVHGNWRYFVDRREDNGKFTAFMSSSDPAMGGMKTEVKGIDDFDTFEQAQNALDGFALKRKFAAERSTPDAEPKMEQQTFGDNPAENSDSVPPVEDPPEVEQGNDPPESGDDSADSANGANETPDFEDDFGNSENDGAEAPPCDWKNASGDDEREPEDEPDNETPDEITGDPLSLRGPEFDAIISTADSVLNRLVAMLHEKKQRDGEMTVKVTFEDANGMGAYIFGGAVSGKINYTVKPQKIVGDAVELQFDAQGNPVIPVDREHQLSFEEVQQTGGTATVDGQTGIIEGYQEDGSEDQDPEGAQGVDSEDSQPDEDLDRGGSEPPDDGFPAFEDASDF